jgi:hypothetical protein
MLRKVFVKFFVSGILISISNLACQAKKTDEVSVDRYLYIQSGGCFAPTGLTASNASKTVSRINLSTGVVDRTLIDYTANLTDIPVAIAPLDDDNMYVLVENTGGRRVEIVNKKTSLAVNYLVNGTALNSVVRSLSFAPDGSFLISKTASAERFASNKNRLPNAATTFLNAPAGTCATSTSTITATAFTTAGDVIYAHAFTAASTNNRIGITTGSTGAASTCYNGYAAPATTSFPTAMVYLKSANQLLVAYSSSTVASNQIWAYDVNETTHTMTPAAAAAYTNAAVVNGPTAIAYDEATGSVYVANGTTAFANSIEKFTYDLSAKTLTRVGTVPFSSPTVNHNCINSMFVGN